jgi:hypothetical protein
LNRKLSDAEAASAELNRKLSDAEAASVAAIAELNRKLSDAEVVASKLRQRLADTQAARTAAALETEIFRRRLNKFRHRAVDAAAHFFDRIKLMPTSVLSVARRRSDSSANS